jgi:hypothetical protein
MMTKKSENSLQTTDLGTLWSETLLDMLNDALRNNWSNNAILEIMKELRNKGYKFDRVAKKLKKKFGEEAVNLLMSKVKVK